MWLSVLSVVALISTAISHQGDYHSHFSVPVADECKSVNASEPPQCPNTIGPPCPPCYTNFASDYKTGDVITFDSGEKQLMEEFMDWYLNWWLINYPPNKTASGYNIFLGSAGRGNIFLRVYMHNKNKTLLDIASQYVSHAISLLPAAQRQQYASYMYGNIGVWFLQAVIDQINNDETSMNRYLSLIKDTFTSVNTAIIEGKSQSSDGLNVDECTLDTGMAGMLYGALLINSHFGSDVIDVSIISTILYHILDIGIVTGQGLNSNYIQYLSFPNCYLWGPGHGNSGIVKSVFTAYDMYPTQLAQLFNTSSKYYIALKNTIDFYSSIQLQDGNIPTNVAGGCQSHYGSDNDARVQWCHGAPGFIGIFLESSILFRKYDASAADKYFESGVAAMNSSWDRGLLVKGTMFCHGIGGNINMFWEAGYFLKQMGETELSNEAVWRAKQFLLWTVNWHNINATRIYDSNEGYSMFQGNFAMPMVYIQALQSEWPFNEPVCMPGWNLCV